MSGSRNWGEPPGKCWSQNGASLQANVLGAQSLTMDFDLVIAGGC